MHVYHEREKGLDHGTVMGHEFVGVVDAGSAHLVGKRVVGEINAVCGGCSACLAQRRTHCEKRTVLGIVQRDGAFAEYLSLPEENLHVVPDAISTDAATFTEPLAAALEIQEQITIAAEDRVLVVGDGKLGQLIAQTLALIPCDSSEVRMMSLAPVPGCSSSGSSPVSSSARLLPVANFTPPPTVHAVRESGRVMR